MGLEAQHRVIGLEAGTRLDHMGQDSVGADLAHHLLALQHGLLPPTANLEHLDPEVPFDCLPGTARLADVGVALSNSFGFGGQNVSLVFEKKLRDRDYAPEWRW